MGLLVADYPDPQARAGVTFPAYVWVGMATIGYADGSARFDLWVHRSAEDAATWPSGERAGTAAVVSVSCGAPVPIRPDVTFPSVAELQARAAAEAAAMMAAATTDDERAAVLEAVANQAATRAAVYALLAELVFPGAVQVD